jgi:hypothetical protein
MNNFNNNFNNKSFMSPQVNYNNENNNMNLNTSYMTYNPQRNDFNMSTLDKDESFRYSYYLIDNLKNAINKVDFQNEYSNLI